MYISQKYMNYKTCLRKISYPMTKCIHYLGNISGIVLDTCDCCKKNILIGSYYYSTIVTGAYIRFNLCKKCINSTHIRYCVNGEIFDPRHYFEYLIHKYTYSNNLTFQLTRARIPHPINKHRIKNAVTDILSKISTETNDNIYVMPIVSYKNKTKFYKIPKCLPIIYKINQLYDTCKFNENITANDQMLLNYILVRPKIYDSTLFSNREISHVSV